MSVNNILAFVFNHAYASAVPENPGFRLAERFRALLGNCSEERALNACRFIDELYQVFTYFEVTKIPFDNGVNVAVIKSSEYCDMMLSEGDHQLLKDSLSFALTSYSAAIAAAPETNLGMAFSRRARALLHAQRFEDCSADISQALRYCNQLGNNEINFLISMKKFCYHRLGFEDKYALIEEYRIMKRLLKSVETSQQKASRLVQALELMLNVQSLPLLKKLALPSRKLRLPARVAHPTPCGKSGRGRQGSQTSTLPENICRIPTHMPALPILTKPITFNEWQWLVLDLKGHRPSKQIPTLEFTNPKNQCFTNAVGFYFDGKNEIAVATRDIFAGELVAVERPWASVVNPQEHCTFCDHCKMRCLTLIPCQHCSLAMFCGESCRTLAWSSHHGDECAILRALLGSLRDWHEVEVATLALRMFFTAWRESKCSLDVMRFRLTSEEAWSIGLPNEQARIQTTRVHFNPVQTTAPNETSLLKASLAAASMTHLLRQHSAVFGKPEGGEVNKNSASGPSTSEDSVKPLHAMQMSMLETRDRKKFSFRSSLQQEDPTKYFEYGLSAALNLGGTTQEQQADLIQDEVMQSIFRDIFPSTHPEKSEVSQAACINKCISKDEKSLTKKNSNMMSAEAQKDNSVGTKSTTVVVPSNEAVFQVSMTRGKITARDEDVLARVRAFTIELEKFGRTSHYDDSEWSLGDSIESRIDYMRKCISKDENCLAKKNCKMMCAEAQKNYSVGTESSTGACQVSMTGKIAPPNEDVFAKEKAFATELEKFGLNSYNDASRWSLGENMQSQADYMKKCIRDAKKTHKKQIFSKDPVGKSKSNSAGKKTRPVVGHPRNIHTNKPEKVCQPLVNDGILCCSEEALKSQIIKIKECMGIQNFSNKIEDIVPQGFTVGEKSSQGVDLSSEIHFPDGCTKRRYAVNFPEEEFVAGPMDNIQEIEYEKGCFQKICDFDNLILSISGREEDKGSEEEENAENASFKIPNTEMKLRVASQDPKAPNTKVLEIDPATCPGTSPDDMRKMNGFVKQALIMMQTMEPCEKARGNENFVAEVHSIQTFCNHLSMLMANYVSQRDEASVKDEDSVNDEDSVKDETSSKSSTATLMPSDESDLESYATAESEMQDMATKTLREELQFAEQVKTYNVLRNLVDRQTMDELHEKMWHQFRKATDKPGDKCSERTTPQVYQTANRAPCSFAKPFVLTELPIENNVEVVEDELKSGIVSFAPRCKDWVKEKPLLFRENSKIPPDPFTFSLDFYDESVHPLSTLMDFSYVAVVFFDFRFCATGLRPYQRTSSLIPLAKRAGIPTRVILTEHTAHIERMQIIRRKEMLAYSAAQVAKFVGPTIFSLPGLWDDILPTRSALGLFYTRNDGPVAAIDDFADGYYKECFRDLGPRTELQCVYSNFLFVTPSGRKLAASVQIDFFHRLLPSKSTINDPQGHLQELPWLTVRQRKLKPEDIYYDPTSMFRDALLPWYYDFFDVIYARRLRAMSCMVQRSHPDNVAFLKAKLFKEMMDFRHRLLMPRPLLGRPVSIAETRTPPPLSTKLEEQIAFVTSMMLSYFHLASKASHIMECTYSADESADGKSRPQRPACRNEASFMSPSFTMGPVNINYSMVGLDSYRPFGAAIYSTTTYLMHSCDPNVFALSTCGDVGVWAAMRHIKKGEKLTMSYGPLCSKMNCFDRRLQLCKAFGFRCICVACEECIQPVNTTLPRPELLCLFCGTELGINRAKRQNPRTLICPKCKKRNVANKSMRRMGEIRGYIELVRMTLYGRPYRSYDYLPQLAKYSAFMRDHVQRPCQLTLAMEEVIKMALIQRIGNFHFVE